MNQQILKKAVMKKRCLILAVVFLISMGFSFQRADAQDKTKEEKQKEQQIQEAIDAQKKAMVEQKKAQEEAEKAIGEAKTQQQKAQQQAEEAMKMQHKAQQQAEEALKTTRSLFRKSTRRAWKDLARFMKTLAGKDRSLPVNRLSLHPGLNSMDSTLAVREKEPPGNFRNR